VAFLLVLQIDPPVSTSAVDHSSSLVTTKIEEAELTTLLLNRLVCVTGEIITEVVLRRGDRLQNVRTV
jgi:hypothetical protein